MWRDPLDELIEDLDEVVQPGPAIRQVPPYELFIEITDRIIRARPYANSEPKDDPKIPRLIAKLLAYRGEGPSPGPPPREPTPDTSGRETDETSRLVPADPPTDPSRT